MPTRRTRVLLRETRRRSASVPRPDRFTVAWRPHGTTARCSLYRCGRAEVANLMAMPKRQAERIRALTGGERETTRMDERTLNALRLLPDYLAQHVLLSLVALGLGILIGLPLAVVATRHRGLRIAALAAASLVQTIPGLRVAGAVLPVAARAVGAQPIDLRRRLPALGFLPSVMALTLYAVLPVLRNAIAGLAASTRR